ncbi:MAG: DUF3820 family protein [Sulfurimonas sp.]|jgi:hypothetical protein
MSQARFIFTKHQNSFSVFVENLEQLSVIEIQNIETFVNARQGFFDFESYTFSIAKRLDFDEFVTLLRHVEIDAKCEEKTLEIQSYKKIEFGQYKGMFYSELPDSYLIWLKSSYRGVDRENIDMELKKRSL